MTYEVGHEKLNKLIKLYFKHKKALFTWGHIGIGKSEVFNQTSQEIGKEMNREFVEWNKTTAERKDEVMKDLKKYFIFIDERLAENDSTDLKGLVDFSDKSREYVIWKIPLFAKIMINPESAGVLMMDEINLAPPLVMSSAYKIVYDRIIGGSCINGGWGIFGAGNLEDDGCYTHRISPALADRGGEVILLPPKIEDWTSWAIKNKVDSRIIGFLNFKSINLFKPQEEGEKQKQTTPRGWVRVSTLINEVTDLNDIRDIASCNISEGIASEFYSFVKLQDRVNMKEILKNPDKIKEFDKDKKDGLGIKYFIITALADWYKDGKAKFDDIIRITETLDSINSPEFVSLLWRLCLSYKPEFENEFLKNNTIKLANKYLRYLR